MSLHSYHIFMFPFQWSPKDRSKESFAERHNLNRIQIRSNSQWENISSPKGTEYETELYNEKNFFYKFVHTALYDAAAHEHPVMKHFERSEAYKEDLTYEIKVIANKKEDIYKLHLKSIGLDIFSTGTGMLIFYLENKDYPHMDDVRRINQFGRRVFPPFFDKSNGVKTTKEYELADHISIYGLTGDPSRYHEDFTRFNTSEPWGKARYIESLIDDFSAGIHIEPVVDDRMFTMCWYIKNELSAEIENQSTYHSFVQSDRWHQYLYIDGGFSTCQNDEMQKNLLLDHTYPRWQKQGTLYGMTRYSFMAVSNDGYFPKEIALVHFRTMYVRIAELVLLQRASILKFSAEVSRLSSLDSPDNRKLADQISDFYKAYIRFVNQIFFREVTAQEQGIELYDMLTNIMRIKDQVKDLDNEIGELHNYATLLDEKSQSRSLVFLTIMGSLLLVPSFIAGFFGMNFFGSGEDLSLSIPLFKWVVVATIVLALLLAGVVFLKWKRKDKWATAIIVFIIVSLITLISIPIFL